MTNLSRSIRDPMRVVLLLGTMFCTLTGDNVSAPEPSPSEFVILRGSDTVAIERSSRSATRLLSNIIAGAERTWLNARIGPDRGVDSVDMRYETSISRPRLQIAFGERGYRSLFVNSGDIWRAKT